MNARDRLASARLYLCTDARERQGDLAQFLDAALRGGVDIVQLRQKGLEARAELAYADLFAAVTARYGALWAVNDRADVAAVSGSPVLHLGQDDLPVSGARRIVGSDPVIGRSSHDLDQALAAATEAGTDYFSVGPCWPTPTKPGRPAPGLDLVRYVAGIAPPAEPGSRPWFAIGGIDEQRLDSVLAAGARRIVVVRAITEATDPEAAARALRERLVGAVNGPPVGQPAVGPRRIR
ncbi:MAG: thiamine phosphate synthase [Actinobacteria bacterium]|nr:thiamine phosphate synthase [Actinomycetota bacterium]